MRIVALALAVALAGPFAASAAAARPTAELSVGSATAVLTDGRLVVDLVARNGGSARARASLAAISWRSVQGRRVGRSVVLRRVPLRSVRASGRRALRTSLRPPAGAAGVYEVRVCLDIRRRVRERREHDNCRSAGDVVVPAAEAPPDGAAPAPEIRTVAATPVTVPDPGPALPPPGPDLTAPQTAITQGPPAVYGLRVATFVFASSERGTFLECRLDDAPWAGCTSPQSFSSLAEGAHRFEVRARDAAGNVDPTPAVHEWTVDLTRPDVTITGGPTGAVATGDAALTFTSTDATATFQCRADGGAWNPCSSPEQLTALADGAHTLDVRAIDAALNTSSPFASRSWTVDTAGPETSIGQGPPALSNQRTATFAFSSPDAGASFQCRLDDASWQACTSPVEYSSLSDGAHHVDVRAIDAAGNPDLTPATHDWTVDATRPDVAITGGPTGTVATGDAAFTFSSTDATATFQCRADGGSWNPCSSPEQLTALADGAHTLDVRAVDAAGNASSPVASGSWTVDTTGPDTSITSELSGDVPAGDVTVAFTSPETGATFECSVDRAAWAPCSSPFVVAAPAAGPHTFEVRARDALGNRDASPATATWTSLAPDPPPAAP